MGLFEKANHPQVPERDKLLRRFGAARSTLLSVLLFTAVNIVLLVTNANSYFLFSAFIPYAIMDYAMYFCGKYPAEFYEGDISEYYFLDNSFLVGALVVVAIILGLYLLSWLLSKKPRVGWLIFGLVFFALDTVLMLLMGGEAFHTVLDFIFHAWVLISLIGGIISYYKLKKLPAEEEAPVLQEEVPAPVEEQI